MINVVLIKFPDSGKIFRFQSDGLEIRRGDGCIVETQRGVEYGIAVSDTHEIDGTELRSQPKKILRKIDEDDRKKLDELRSKEEHAFQVCLDRIKARSLPMKLVRVCFLFDESKAIFYFTADGRIDFRGLVKDLAYHFRTRIEMRQIGVRDETKMLGGIGCCGLTVCCSTFLNHFDPVSIKMAKTQNLSLITSKISGLCGRLMCCLVYENQTYCDMMKTLPPVGSTVRTDSGKGMVVGHHILNESVRIELEDGDVKSYHYKDITVLETPKIIVEPEDDFEEEPDDSYSDSDADNQYDDSTDANNHYRDQQ